MGAWVFSSSERFFPGCRGRSRDVVAFAHWVDAISDILETAITDGELTDTPTAHRLAWNPCAGTVGAANASATLREDIDLATCLEDVVTAQLRNAFTPA